MRALVSDTVARLRVCRDAQVPVPEDLLHDAVECLEKISVAADQRARRDQLIRRAALLFPGSSNYQAAACLAAEARAMSRVWKQLSKRLPPEPPQTARDYLHSAGLFAELPISQRQFYRVLQGEKD